jgi:hypothetical protein
VVIAFEFELLVGEQVGASLAVDRRGCQFFRVS